jgi:hypothetical protein
LNLQNDPKSCAIDHDHKIADRRISIRGLICQTCNFMLGLAKDDPEILQRAARYIEIARIRYLFGHGAADAVIERFDFSRFAGNFVGFSDPLIEKGANMTAVVEVQGQICIVHRIGREGLRVKIDTYCQNDLNASSVKVIQLPDDIIRHPKVCVSCKQNVTNLTDTLKQ